MTRTRRPRNTYCLTGSGNTMTLIDKYSDNWLSLALFCVVMACAGCKVTETDLEYWRGTAKGPVKIAAVMSADKYDMDLRTRAAMALVEMDRQDVDGITELQNGLSALDDAERKQIISGMVPMLEQAMKSSAQADSDAPATAKQIRTKDAAFLLISTADAQTKERLTKAVVNWYVEDFEGRSLSGAHSAEQVIRALGAPAATSVVETLQSKLASPALVKITELINDVGDASTKTKAAKKLVAIEQEMEGDAFLKWLESEVKKQLDKDKKSTDAAHLTKVAELNRTKFIVEGALPAMKNLAKEKEIADRLLQIASTPGNDSQTQMRVAALQALEGSTNKSQLQQVLALALDPKSPISVRDYAFDRVGDIRSYEAIAPMWPLVESAKDDRLRWRAGELVLAIGGNSVLSQFFAKLPSGDKVEYPPEELEGYAARMGQISPLPTAALKAQLDSPDWWNRVIALNFFIRRGTKADLASLQGLTNDSAKVKGKGWEKDETVGGVAKKAITAMQERLAEGSSQATATPAK